MKTENAHYNALIVTVHLKKRLTLSQFYANHKQHVLLYLTGESKGGHTRKIISNILIF